MLLVKYGAILTENNKAGTDLDVLVISDVGGGTTTCAVAEGDLVLETIISGTSVVTGKIWKVHDGEAWDDLTPEGEILPGTLVVSTAPDVPFQQGGMVVFLENNQYVGVNLNQTINLIEAITGP